MQFNIVQKSNCQLTTDGQGRAASKNARGSDDAVPWSGGLNPAELERPGGMLLAALLTHANERGQRHQDMASSLGVTPGYVNQLRSGHRQVNQISDKFSMACAAYLGIPRLAVLFMAGRLTQRDAFEREEMFAAEVPRAMTFVCQDPDWGPLMTAQIRSLDIDGQFTLVRLYEAATKRKLLSDRLSPERWAEELKRFRAVKHRLVESANDSLNCSAD
ncbi:DNA-binding protein [Paucibacter soli]|uniref:DNA-binding protein n=1 Tax=Paucibacter soli TaxID=3133433 RepID=UPI0030A0C1BB